LRRSENGAVTRQRPGFPGFKSIKNFDDGMAMFSEVFLAHLDLHFSLMLLQTQLCMLLEPPRRNVTFTDTAKDW
jgi:hypothetical protein